ncbi:MAG: hypothetical protein V2I56_13035 [Desulfobacteraceae bacterium]|jgi:hypothetical protein|nr:hypothetical protein [Desulfobacteraceae bacterium]
MDNWIPFGEGEYLVEQALLVAANDCAVAVDSVLVEVYADQRGQRYLKGRGRIRNILMVELLEDSDDLDLLLDFGDEFKFLLKEPIIHAGKVFSPDARSVFQFNPQTPWQQIAPTEFDDRISRLRLLGESDIF